MEKGIIMEVKRRKAVILTTDGEFKTIRLPKGQSKIVGQEINLAQNVSSPKVTMRKAPVFSASIAALVICFVLVNTFLFQSENVAVAAFVSFDINPSIELSVDKNLGIIEVVTINEDARQLIPDFEQYYGKNIDDFSNVLLRKLKTNGFLESSNELLVVTTVQDEKLEDDLQANIQNSFENAKRQTSIDSVEVVVKNTTLENHNDAIEKGLSTGKYITYLEAKSNGSDLLISEVKKMPLVALQNEIESNKEKEEAETPAVDEEKESQEKLPVEKVKQNKEENFEKHLSNESGNKGQTIASENKEKNNEKKNNKQNKNASQNSNKNSKANNKHSNDDKHKNNANVNKNDKKDNNKHRKGNKNKDNKSEENQRKQGERYWQDYSHYFKGIDEEDLEKLREKFLEEFSKEQPDELKDIIRQYLEHQD